VALKLLRTEPPYGPLRLLTLHVSCRRQPVGDTAAVLALTEALPAHASLRRLKLIGARLAESHVAFDALVDAALSRLQSLAPVHVTLPPTVASSLARLLGGGTLTELRMESFRSFLDDPAAAAVLAAALRASTALTSVQLGLWRGPAAAVLLGALTGHPRLQHLVIVAPQFAPPDDDNDEADAVAGAALGALLAADAPALTCARCTSAPTPSIQPAPSGCCARCAPTPPCGSCMCRSLMMPITTFLLTTTTYLF
jgi:hypothetical protein